MSWGSNGWGSWKAGSRGHDEDKGRGNDTEDAKAGSKHFTGIGKRSKAASEDSWNYVKPAHSMEVDENAPFDKKTGKMYPCGQCGGLFGHREMIISRREQHKMEWEAAPESLDPEGINQAKRKKDIRYKRVCEACEVDLRLKEGHNYPDLRDVRIDIRRKSKGDEWGARGKFYKEAVHEVDQEKDLSKEERAKKKTARCKELAEDFLVVLKQGGLMEIFGEAGQKIREMQQQWALLEQLTDEWEKAGYEEDRTRLHKLLREAEKKWDDLHEYELFADRGEQQYKFIRAQDYDDRLTDHLSRFYACPQCGHYFFSKFWVKRFSRWYCEMNFTKWCELADPEDVKKLQKEWGNDPATWPRLGCGKQYQPWALGQGLVIEYFSPSSGEWKSFRADLIPEVLDDAIKKKQVEFNASMKSLTPEEVYDLIPRTYPRANPVAMAGFDHFPGLGYFDLKKWAQENQPVLTTTGWLKLALKVAENDLEHLIDVFNVARDELRKYNNGEPEDVSQSSSWLPVS